MKLPLLLIALLWSLQSFASTWQDNNDIAVLFRDAGVAGTFVVYDVGTQQLTGYNQKRAQTRFVPASTFKIANTMIGLTNGVVGSVDEVLPYGGQPQPFKVWEQDMSLRNAIAISNAAIYQELARRIGVDDMRAGVAGLAYGNQDVGTQVDQFWLQGPLKISAVEQTQFLARLARSQLPFPAAVQVAARDIVQMDQGDGWALYGKTGWQNAPGPGVGWWVGWLQKRDRLYSFALNIDIEQPADASKRLVLGKASLRMLGLL